MNINKLSASARIDINDALSDRFNGNEKRISDEINISSVSELFDIYLRYNGIVGYTDSIIEALDSIRAAKADK